MPGIRFALKGKTYSIGYDNYSTFSYFVCSFFIYELNIVEHSTRRELIRVMDKYRKIYFIATLNGTPLTYDVLF